MLREQPKHQQGSDRSGYEFDEKTDNADRRLATPTATAEAQPADDGNKVDRGQRQATGRAVAVRRPMQADAARQPIAGAVDE